MDDETPAGRDESGHDESGHDVGDENDPHDPRDRPAPLDAGDPESAYELLQRGLALAAQRHHAQASVVLARADGLEPGRGSILEPLGRAYFMSGQLERARETFEALLAVDPSSHYGHYALGRALVRLGRVDEGRTHLRLAVALAPDSRLYRGGLNRLGGAGEERR